VSRTTNNTNNISFILIMALFRQCSLSSVTLIVILSITVCGLFSSSIGISSSTDTHGVFVRAESLSPSIESDSLSESDDFFSFWSIFHIVTLTCVALLATGLYFIYPRYPHGVELMPSVPVFGSLLFLTKGCLSEGSAPFMSKLAKQVGYRTLGWGALGLPAQILVTDPACVKHMLVDNFDNYEKGNVLLEIYAPSFGEGIFTTDGALWRHQRKTASHVFSLRALRDDMFPIMVDHARVLRDHVLKTGESGKEFDMQDMFFRYTLEVITQIAFGRELNSITADAPFMYHFDQAQHLCTMRFFTPGWKVMKALGVGAEGRIVNHSKFLHEFADETIRQRHELAAQSLLKRTDLLSRFIKDIRSEETFQDARFLRNITLNFILAGRDTTASLLTSSVWRLGQHTELVDKLRQDIAHHAPDGKLTYESVSKMKYLEAFLMEVLRLHPPVPLNIKVAKNDDRMPDGTPVRAGMVVNWAPYAMGRRTDIWGDDAEEFNVSRWFNGDDGKAEPGTSARIRLVPDHINPVFNVGLRNCLGKHVALLEAKTCLATLLPAMRLNVRANQSSQPAISVILIRKHGLKATCQKR
jgi:cytochrome P450